MPIKGPNHELIVVNVTFKFGIPKYHAFRFSNSQPVDSSISLATGTTVGWYVRVTDSAGSRTPPYQITFSDPSILGVASLEVPSGGASSYLHVLAIEGQAKYTISIDGITPVFDPDIQVDNSPDIFREKGKVVKHAHFVAVWDVTGTSMTFTKDDVPVNSPLQPALLDTVEFQVTGGVGIPEFAILFPVPHTWASPFSPGTSTFPGKQGTPTTGQLTVNDESDFNGTSFDFHGEAIIGGGGSPVFSNTYSIKLGQQ
jgi:hypothetical protein